MASPRDAIKWLTPKKNDDLEKICPATFNKRFLLSFGPSTPNGTSFIKIAKQNKIVKIWIG